MLGWDTDMFPMDLDMSTYIMMLVSRYVAHARWHITDRHSPTLR